GSEEAGPFSVAPSRTNLGSTRPAGRSVCSRTRERIAVLVRSRRGRSIGPGKVGRVIGTPSEARNGRTGNTAGRAGERGSGGTGGEREKGEEGRAGGRSAGGGRAGW